MGNPQNLLLDQSVRRVFRIQLLVAAAVLVAVGFLAVLQVLPAAGLALASGGYGCLLALVSTYLSARSVRRTPADAVGTAGMVPVFSGLLNKLVIVGGGIALGLVAFGLDPLLVVTGYLVVQMASLWTLLKPENQVFPGGETD